MNIENDVGMTSLHSACLAGSVKAVDLLLEEPTIDFIKKDKVSKAFFISVEEFHSVALRGSERLSQIDQAPANEKAFLYFTEEVSLLA